MSICKLKEPCSVTLVKSNAKALSAEPKVHCALRGFKEEHVTLRLFRKKTSRLPFCAYPPYGWIKKEHLFARHIVSHEQMFVKAFLIFFSVLFTFCVFYEKCIVIVLRGKRNAFSRAGFVRICTPTIVFNIRQKLYLKDLAR